MKLKTFRDLLIWQKAMTLENFNTLYEESRELERMLTSFMNKIKQTL